MNPWMYVGAAASLLVLAIMFVPLERAWAARTQPVLRREFALDVVFFVGQYVWWNAVSLVVLIHLHRGWRHIAPGALNTWPTWLQLMLALILGELATYWLHRAFHRFDLLWRIHAVHHSSTHLDWIAAHREHPLDGILIQLSMNLPAILLGFSFAAFGPLILFRGLWAIVVHSNTTLPLGPLRWVLGAPQLHRYHHAAQPDRVANFANLSPWIDALFGTHHVANDETYAVGRLGQPRQRRPWVAYVRLMFFRVE